MTQGVTAWEVTWNYTEERLHRVIERLLGGYIEVTGRLEECSVGLNEVTERLHGVFRAVTTMLQFGNMNENYVIAIIFTNYH